ncbi:NUDIX hydrolase [Streptomyces sp. DH41]|uniref:NUDIX hydrolase n=1 Tax=Streptomyces sp. DH41 TaxID=3040125 RepID=UPI00244215B5|nr:NUDIX hydrolase [Streptomyces sp. DH41]MDG9728374.1 NUDIX hydrolase [Streptomyces sp. DH41]
MAVQQPTYEEWLASMARSTSAAAAVFHDAEFRVLLLHATYEDSWQLPGGTVEHGQDPWQAAVREVLEETGHQLPVCPQLLGVDWYRPTGLDPYAQFLFRGPRVDRAQFSVTLSHEHDAWDLRTPEDWEPLIGPQQAARLTLACDALRTGHPLYLQDGRPVGS